MADFGFANNFTPGQQLNTWCGSPPYAAPELFQGKEYAGPEVDIWSLGVVLYVLVCGSLPFDGSTLPKLRARVIAGKFKVPFYMSPDCERIIKHMLMLDPPKRATLKQVMLDKWFQEGYAAEHPEITVSAGWKLTPDQHKDVLDELERIGIDTVRAEKAVLDEDYDSHAATYYLIADKLFRAPIIDTHTAALDQHQRAQTTQPKPTLVAEPADLDDKSDKLEKSDKPEHPRLPAAANPLNAAPATPAASVARGTTKTRRATVGEAPKVAQLRETISKDSAVRPPPTTPKPDPPKPDSKDEVLTREQAKKHISVNDEPRTTRFTMSLATTTTRDPADVMESICDILDAEKIKYSLTPHIATCKVDQLEFELEVCRIAGLPCYCLRYKRISGSTWDYKGMLAGLISKLNL